MTWWRWWDPVRATSRSSHADSVSGRSLHRLCAFRNRLDPPVSIGTLVRGRSTDGRYSMSDLRRDAADSAVTIDDLVEFGQVFLDLADPAVMERAWN